jgi:pimeloyl-ACP methyl ester carboxylesterase
MAKPAVIMVHGAFCAGWAFETFREPFERAGFRVIAPDLPGHGLGEPREAVTGLSMSHYATAVATMIADEPEPPILIGHSLGGLVAQMAAQRSAIHALILLAPSPPWGASMRSVRSGSRRSIPTTAWPANTPSAAWPAPNGRQCSPAWDRKAAGRCGRR